MKFIWTLCFLLATVVAGAQTGSVRGKVVDATSQESVPFANVIIQGTTIGTSTDIDGNFEIKDVPVGYVKVEVSVVGYNRQLSEDVYVTTSKTPFVEIGLTPTSTQLEEVEIKASPFVKTEESPVSLQTLGVEEIERNPGANRDISRVIQSLPGVASTPSFRNDIIIRGGAPNENRFYLDDIETPVINHFQTQGSSGGPVGMLNVNLVREVNLYTGAFPANRGNALSSVLEFKQIDGNKDKLNFRGTVGSSDLALALDGPIGEKTTFVASARRSYLQGLFSILGLPFLPTYNDAQFKVKHKFNPKNEIYFVGLGAIDQFRLNLEVNDRIDDEETIERNEYLLGNLPVNEQWNYTIGGVYKHYGKNSFQTFVLSRNTLNNTAEKYAENDDSSSDNLILDYESVETENKFRFENTTRLNGWKIKGGVNLENAVYSNRTFNRIGTPNGVQLIDYNSDLTIVKYGVFAQASKTLLNARLILSAGFRMDGNDYNSDMENPLNQFSPRISASYAITERFSFNFNTGRYYQLPAYPVLGFRDNAGVLVNQPRTSFIESDHLVGGFQYNPDNYSKITIEGFYKTYTNYPFSLRDSLSLANLGADFGVVGNEPTTSIGEGRAYGVEMLTQRRARNGIFGIAAYTWVRSEFLDPETDTYAPSAWDSRHILTLTAGKKMKRNWEIGVKWRYVGGLPYTPFDEEASSLRENWDVRGQGILDFNRLNSERFDAFTQLDVRVDKTWYLKKWSLNLYVDIQNLTNFQSEEQDFLNVATDEAGNPLIDPNDPTRYQMTRIENTSGTVLPTIGIIVDF
ncbi:MAG: carboxypeptidase-like regulatory domain-containing protein [Salibacteraceae bacterium]